MVVPLATGKDVVYLRCQLHTNSKEEEEPRVPFCFFLLKGRWRKRPWASSDSCRRQLVKNMKKYKKKDPDDQTDHFNPQEM